MTLIDLINEVKQSRNKVIPTAFILNRLREVERHDRVNYGQTSADTDEDRLKNITAIWGGG